ncbi:MAG: flavin reductase family protein [Saprospiraceae bacterium]|nr:flavin reductase family protein [Pyrinomonadaceae bacterium]
MPIDQHEFRAALAKFASGVTVVTTKDAEGRFHGITVSAFSSVSLDPPLVMICIEKTAGSHDALIGSATFVVNVLSQSQAAVSERFATQIQDKFRGVEFNPGIEGVPVLAGCLVNLECRVQNFYDGGDHSLFVGRVEKATIMDGSPLVYFHGNYRALTD